jgi:hypothetical protein
MGTARRRLARCAGVGHGTLGTGRTAAVAPARPWPLRRTVGAKPLQAKLSFSPGSGHSSTPSRPLSESVT